MVILEGFKGILVTFKFYGYFSNFRGNWGNFDHSLGFQGNFSHFLDTKGISAFFKFLRVFRYSLGIGGGNARESVG